MKEFFDKFLTSKQRELDVQRAYALLMLANEIMSEADDIEDVYNARKVFEYAFLSNNLTPLMNQNPFIKLSKRNFEQLYKHKNLIKRGVLNHEAMKDVHDHLQALLTRLRHSVNSELQLDKEVHYVFNSKDDFVTFARTYSD